MTSIAVPGNVAVTLDHAVEMRLDKMAAQLAELTAELRAQREQRAALQELVGELTTVSGPALALLTERLAELEERGYVAFAKQGAAIVDRVVTSFSEDDVASLGDNVVLILETLREMTQPDVMQMLRQTAHLVNDPPAESADAPSLLDLARALRDPETRRGLARVLAMLHTVGERPHSHGHHPAGQHQPPQPPATPPKTTQEVP